ncbi:MAG: hypothetical protein C4288_08545 [Leptolyngbya sp. ERB_1_1]
MIQPFLKRHRKLRFCSNQAKASGFTLVELLVAMIVASLISAGLLFMVVQLVQTNLREAARSDTQRDLQAALDYIARDVREAVYVYDASCLLDRPTSANATTSINALSCPGLRNYLPTRITGSSGFGYTDSNGTNIPVLAFWRLNPLPPSVNTLCQNFATSYSQRNSRPPEVQGVACLAGQMYSLVVYSLNNSKGGAVTKGRARIMRYELPQFTSQTVLSPGTAPTPIPGWVDPRGKASDGNNTSFLTWPVSQAMLNNTSTLPVPNPRPSDSNVSNQPLTDFVDWNGLYNLSSNPVTVGQATNRSSGSGSTTENLILTPADGTSGSPPRGFHVYVRGAQSGGSLNQQVVIRIQGDAAGRPGVPDLTPNRPVVPISLETTVLTRGVTNKTQ